MLPPCLGLLLSVGTAAAYTQLSLPRAAPAQRTQPPVALFDGLGATLIEQAAVYTDAAQAYTNAAQSGLSTEAARLLALLQTPESAALLTSPKLAIAAFFIPGLAVVFSGRGLSPPTGNAYSAAAPYREGFYDPKAGDRFFALRPWLPLGRLFALTSLTGGFVLGVLTDKWSGREEDEATIARRSQQLLELVSQLGPTFIKVGQALSIRQDLLPAPYVRGLVQLQDNVRR